MHVRAKEEAYATLKAVFEIGPTDGLALYNCFLCLRAVRRKRIRHSFLYEEHLRADFKAVTNRAKTDDGFDSLP